MQKIREVFVGAYGALTKAVQEHGRERFAAGSRTSSQVSLIKDVFPVPKFVIEHRKKIAKIYKDEIFQQMAEPRPKRPRVEENDRVVGFLEAIEHEPNDAKDGPAIEAFLRRKFTGWMNGDESPVPELLDQIQQLNYHYALKGMADMEKADGTPLSRAKKEEAFNKAKLLAWNYMKTIGGKRGSSQVRTLQEAARESVIQLIKQDRATGGEKAVACRADSLRDVEFVHADDSDEREDSQGARNNDDNEQRKEVGPGTVGHRNPDNVNASGDSIQLPQLFTRGDKTRETMEKTLWQLIGHTKPSLVNCKDHAVKKQTRGNAVSRQLGNIPVPFLIKRAENLYQNQLQDLHRIGEQQDLSAQLQTGSRPASRGVIGAITQQPSLPLSLGTPTAGESLLLETPGAGLGKKENSLPIGTPSSTGSYPKAQASPSLSSSISTFPTSARPASMSSSASTIRPIPPSSPSPSPSLRNAVVESNVHGSGILSTRGSSQPRSTRGSQLIGAPLERRLNSPMTTLLVSPRDETFVTEVNRQISEPAHPFHQATLSASVRLGSPTRSTQSSRSSPERSADHGNPTIFQDHDRASTVSSSSTPYSQSNSTSQIFEETSFFNQLSSNDSFSRAHQRAELMNNDRGTFQASPFAQTQGVYGLGFMDQTPFYAESNDRDRDDDDEDDDDDDDDDADHTDKDTDSASQDESGPLSEQIKQLHLEDVLAFLPSGAISASGVLSKAAEDGYQRRTASGDNMPFQLDDELASLGTRALEEVLGHEGGDEEDDHKVRGIRFKEAMGPSRMRSLGRDGH
ncbi:hypothetical protein BGZ65_004182 [Modicella reniformis]|uniref:Uncharacterized protein n=1 Tax=Modicella reniformis TaxID=1440133 RepID=A0A9P6LZI2_9FUNG|nr:hypothetical protein BGZ65_004182 [Modicella reniformis]